MQNGNEESEIERAAEMVESMIRKQGIDPETVRMSPPGQGRATLIAGVRH